jgi:hypothetical protein
MEFKGKRDKFSKEIVKWKSIYPFNSTSVDECERYRENQSRVDDEKLTVSY